MALQQNYRLINIDRLDADSPVNFDLSTLVPSDPGSSAAITSSAEAQALAGQIRQLLRGGDAEGALRGALEHVPYGADDRAKEEVGVLGVQQVIWEMIQESSWNPKLQKSDLEVCRWCRWCRCWERTKDWGMELLIQVFEQEVHLATVTEILQSIKQSDMSPLLNSIYRSERGSEMLDVLMKYIYKGMQYTPHASGDSSKRKSISPQPTGFSQIHSRGAAEGGGAAMSVLLSWHEKLVEIAGPGSIIRVMTDRRTV